MHYCINLDNQFGFNHKHSTGMCIYLLKEIANDYKRHKTTLLGTVIESLTTCPCFYCSVADFFLSGKQLQYVQSHANVGIIIEDGTC